MPSKPAPDRFLNFKEVAAMIGVSWTTIRDGKAGTREIPRIKLGGRVLFSLNAVQKWMERKAREAEQSNARSQNAVADLLAGKGSQRRAVERTLLTIINGGKYR